MFLCVKVNEILRSLRSYYVAKRRYNERRCNLNIWPRPGNLWAILDRMNGPMCAAALIDNGLRDGAGLRSPVFFP
jgi:hypothetical protein